jgi:ElaB/YqjD/DUF883 family membrane-anchored ribosome-binding protein
MAMTARNDAKDGKTDASQFEEDIEQLKADIKKLSETIVGLGRDGVGTVQSEGAERLGAWRGTIEDQVKERPFLTLLGAFGVGLVVSRLIDRR